MTRVTINVDDNDRALLSDALPYETPLIFNNEGLYRYKRAVGEIAYSHEITDEQSVINNLLCPNKKYTIPFEFRIRNNANDRRALCVVHPKSQISISSFYSRFDHQIVHQCSLSPASLRYPASVAKYYFESGGQKSSGGHKMPGVEIEASASDDQPKYGASYFSYKKYNFLYKFFDSNEFIGLEKRFHFLLLFDISKCFPSIYTHSISWAIKDKEFSKEHTDTYSFESEFDRLMQNANYNETNGIVIGPEVCRIFAEIILQRIDRTAIRKIEKNLGLKHNIDYAVRRYVDDYHIFCRDEDVAESIYSVFLEELETYKLHVNPAKTERITVPFSTNLTRARVEIGEYFDSQFEEVFDATTGKIAQVNRSRSRRWIVRLKSIVGDQSINYYGVSSLAISRLKTFLLEVFEKSNKEEALRRDVTNLVIVVLEVIFFIYSMDTRVRTTYVVSQAIVFIRRKMKNFPEEMLGNVEKMIFDESLHVLRAPPGNLGIFSTEKQNLLIALGDLGEEYYLPQLALADIGGFAWSKEKDEFEVVAECDYFQVVSLLFYMKDRKRYAELRSAIEKIIVRRLRARSKFSIYSEYAMLLLDSLSCPYVSSATKNLLARIAIKEAGGGAQPSHEFLENLVALCSSRDWFTNWSSYINIQHLLNKKELKTPYD